MCYKDKASKAGRTASHNNNQAGVCVLRLAIRACVCSVPQGQSVRREQHRNGEQFKHRITSALYVCGWLLWRCCCVGVTCLTPDMACQEYMRHGQNVVVGVSMERACVTTRQVSMSHGSSVC